MPVYEYFCPNCESKFELLRPMKCANEDAFCPICNNIGKRLVSVFSSLSKNSEGISTPIGGFDKCTGCSSDSCSTCI